MMTTMKHNVMRAAAVALFVAGLSATAALAQDAPPPPPPADQTQGPPAGGPGGRGMNPERRMEMLQKQLKLSPDQATQLKSILDDQRAKMETLRSNTSLTQQDRRSQMMTMHQEEETKIHAVLTPDQQKKYDDMEARMRERMQERRKDGGQTPPAPGI
jgi:Spy/CpxP family protein refolding chaperone